MDEQRTTTEVRTEESVGDNTAVERQTTSERTSVPGSVLAQRIIWYIAGLIVGLLAIRLVLQLLGANQGNGFVDFIYGLSAVFAAPFFGMFSYSPTYGQSYFEISTLVAIFVYLLIGWAIAKLFTLGSARTTV